MHNYKPAEQYKLRDRPVEISKPTSYTFWFEPRGWMIATINNKTGEFQITSDWGNFAYRWNPNPKCLGSKNLTHFLAKADCDYITDKLGYENHNLKDIIDEKETLKALRKKICLKRRARDIDEDEARDLWDRADEWADADFNIHATPSEFWDWVIDYGIVQYTKPYVYTTLTELLLPTLKKYLNEVVLPAEKE